MRRAWLVLVFGWLAIGCKDSAGPDGPLDLSREWEVASPAAVGLDPDRLEVAAAEAAAISPIRSLLVARRGRLAFERYFVGAGPDTRFDVRSVTKSIVATLVGIALDDGVLSSVEASAADWLHGFQLDAHDRSVTLRHLLSMTGGWQWDEWVGDSYQVWWSGPDHLQYLLNLPSAATPGAYYTYNSAAVHLLGFVLGRAAGVGLPAFAEDVLFDPVGIASAEWEPFENGTVNGGAGIDLTGRDLLRFGQLYLQEGRSGNRQVVPPGWIAAVTTPQSDFLTTVGPMGAVRYGYLWWLWPARGAYFAWGYGGQFVFVSPADDLVVVLTSEWRGQTGADAAFVERAGLRIIVEEVVSALRD